MSVTTIMSKGKLRINIYRQRQSQCHVIDCSNKSDLSEAGKHWIIDD